MLNKLLPIQIHCLTKNKSSLYSADIAIKSDGHNINRSIFKSKNIGSNYIISAVGILCRGYWPIFRNFFHISRLFAITAKPAQRRKYKPKNHNNNCNQEKDQSFFGNTGMLKNIPKFFLKFFRFLRSFFGFYSFDITWDGIKSRLFSSLWRNFNNLVLSFYFFF